LNQRPLGGLFGLLDAPFIAVVQIIIYASAILVLFYFVDITSCFRRYSERAIRLLLSKDIKSKSFDILFETTMYVYRSRLTISEVPITYSFSSSSLNSRVVRDCVRMCLNTLLRPGK